MLDGITIKGLATRRAETTIELASGQSFAIAGLMQNNISRSLDKYPGLGRDLDYTFGEIGLAGHWIKHILHHMFIYKAKLKAGWTLIPE